MLVLGVVMVVEGSSSSGMVVSLREPLPWRPTDVLDPLSVPTSGPNPNASLVRFSFEVKLVGVEERLRRGASLNAAANTFSDSEASRSAISSGCDLGLLRRISASTSIRSSRILSWRQAIFFRRSPFFPSLSSIS